MKKTTFLITISCLVMFGCKKNMNSVDDVSSLPETGIVVNALEEKILQNANPNVPIGAAVSTTLLAQASSYRELAKVQYNSITAENGMKMITLQPQEGTFDFSNYTIQNLALNFGKKRIHGHTLVWHAGLPQWVKNWETTTLPNGVTRAAKFDTIMSRHIRKVIQNYDHPATQFVDDNSKPLMKSWDVVNEALYDDGKYRSTTNIVNGADKGSIWYRTIGKSYVQKAYTYARKAAQAMGDTNLKLFYNDYGHDYSQNKLDSIYKMVMALKAITVNGQPIIDGIGMQFHIAYNTPIANIKNAFIKMASTGLIVHVAELDIRLNTTTTPLSPTELANRLALQKQKYMDVAFLYRKYVVAEQRWGITTWNMGDADSWLTYNSSGQQVDSPCLYDINYTKKDAFYYLYDGLYLAIPASY